MTASRMLEGRVALITGSVRRIGLATAEALAAQGAHVAIHAKSSLKEGEAALAALWAKGYSASFHMADVTDESAVMRLHAEVTEVAGAPDILVNNAAVRAEVPFLEMTLADWHGVMAPILEGAVLTSRACLPAMIERRWGRIINIGGVSAYVGSIERAHVSAAKAGLAGLTRALAVEFAPYGITVNCVSPGKIGGKRSSTSGNTVRLPAGIQPILPGESLPLHVAQMVATLCGGGGEWTTGQTIHVNGGMYFA